jgi:mono/diheme cytochrome c family protein
MERRRRLYLVVSALVLGAIAAWWLAAGRFPDMGAGGGTRAFIDTYCATCHNEIDRDGGFAFVTGGNDVSVSAASDEPDAVIWEKAVRKVHAGLMPPAEAARPERAALEAFARSVEKRLDAAWVADPDPGAEPLSRLNRAEYRNAVRDLLAFDATAVVDTLPVDEAVAGFDNIGDGLTVSPTLIEGYVSAATAIARQAVGDRAAGATQIRYPAPAGLSQDEHIDGLPLGTRGGFVVTHFFPLDATYELRVAGPRGNPLASQRLCDGPEIAVALDGRLLDVEAAQFRMIVPAGPHTLAVALADPARCVGVNELYGRYEVQGGIQHVEIHGPFDAAGPGDTPSRRAIFRCYPDSRGEESACAREILTALAGKAFRGPLAADAPEVETLLEFYRAGHAEGGFEAGIRQALARVLMSPQFIFQLEREPAHLAAGHTFRLTDLEIATRLSFFLWSSLPDGELVTLASGGRLGEPDVLEDQVSRMLRDPRARALVDNFASQWLSLRELNEALPQDADFDANLRGALELETKLLVSKIVDEDSSVLELLEADYTFLNERLARHYGVAGVRGSHMREVALDPAGARRGLLGHGSWLTATSVADRTSPVIRGEWFVTHMLGAPVPEPPPGVEADLSDEADIAREGDTLRERLERHRANPNCAACHQIMDPIGLALENFDLVGRWRELDGGRPIDATATLIDGTVLRGPEDLRQALLSRSELFVTALTEKLLTYAIGRVVDYRDMPAVRDIIEDAAEDDYRFSSLVRGIASSPPFLMRAKTGGEPPAADAPRQARAANTFAGGEAREQ